MFIILHILKINAKEMGKGLQVLRAPCFRQRAKNRDNDQATRLTEIRITSLLQKRLSLTSRNKIHTIHTRETSFVSD